MPILMISRTTIKQLSSLRGLYIACFPKLKNGFSAIGDLSKLTGLDLTMLPVADKDVKSFVRLPDLVPS